jgi:plasmid stability protein
LGAGCVGDHSGGRGRRWAEIDVLSIDCTAINAIFDFRLETIEMAMLTIRKLSDVVKGKLRVRAAENGRSMEEEARRIIEDAVGPEDKVGLAEAIHRIFAPLGGVDLELPPGQPVQEPPDFSGPEYER